MAISRRERIREELGLAGAEKADALAIRQEEKRREKQAAKRAALENDGDYKLLKDISTVLDGRIPLDPIIGLLCPEFGDLLSFVLGLPYLRVALFKVKSIPLTLAVASNMVIDLLIGALPVVGDLFDVFFRSYKKSYRLIVGFVEDDAEIVKMVKRRAFVNLALIAILGYAVYWVIAKTIFITQSAWQWIAGLLG